MRTMGQHEPNERNEHHRAVEMMRHSASRRMRLTIIDSAHPSRSPIDCGREDMAAAAVQFELDDTQAFLHPLDGSRLRSSRECGG